MTLLNQRDATHHPMLLTIEATGAINHVLQTPDGQKYPKYPKIYLPELSAQAQKFGIMLKKGFIGPP